MNIIYITDLILDENEAASLHVKEICTNFLKLGHSVTLYAPSAGKFKSRNNFAIKYILSTKKLISVLYEPLLFIKLFFELVTWKNKPDVIYVRQSPFTITPIILGKLFHIVIVTELNGIIEEEMLTIHAPSFQIKLGKIIEKFSYLHSDLIITVTEGLKAYIINKYHINEYKIAVIQNGVDTNLFYPQNKEEMRQALNIKSKYCIGYVGVVVKWQGIEFIIKALKEVRKNNIDCNLVIVGNGSEKHNLELLVKSLNLENNVIFTGVISHNDIPKYINSFDICFSYHTYARDGITSPFKLYEYLACGKTVIASNLRGIKEEFYNVLKLVNPEDVQDLSSAILFLLSNSDMRSEYETKAMEYINEGHTWEKVTKLIITNIKGKL